MPRKRISRAGFALAVSLVAALPAGVHAQPAPAALAARDYAIPAGPLGPALNRFAQDAGITLSYESALASGKTSAGLRGRYTPAAGLAALLAGTGLQAVAQPGGGYALYVAPAAAAPAGGSAATLGEVRVTAEAARESAWGPAGRNARRSAAASKTDTPLLETPQSVSVVTRQQMDERGVQTVTEAIQYSSGITGDNAADNRYDKPVIRGFAARQYLDGLFLVYGSGGYNMPRVEPYGLERVEVLRGPSSVLYGANAPGGLLNMVSKRPTTDTLREVGVTVGSNDRRQGQFDFGGAIDEAGVLSYRLTGLVRKGGTQTEHADDDRVFLAPALTIRPHAGTSFTLLGNFQKDQLGTLINFLPREGTLAPSPYGRIPSSFFTGEPAFNRFDREQESVGWAFEHALDDQWTLRQNLRYLRSDLVYQGVYAAGWQPGTSFLRRSSLDDYGDLESTVVDTQLQFRTGAGPVRHTFLAGFDYQQASSYEAQGYGTVGAGLGLINPFAPVYGQRINPIATYTASDQEQRQEGVYLQGQSEIDDRWFFTYGLRHDGVDLTTVTSRIATATGATTSTTAHLAQSDTTYRLGAVHKFASGWAPYVSWSTAFQPQTGVDHLGQAFRPTTARQSEVGVRYQPAAGGVQMLASLYDLRQQNVVASVPEGPVLARRQIGEVRSRGVELEGSVDLPARWQLTGAYTYLDMQILQGSAAETGKTPTNRPRHVASLWLEKQLAGELQGLSFGFGLRYMGTTWGDAANTFEVPSQAVADAALRYRTGQWQVSLNVSNLADKEYVGTCGSATTCYYEYRRNVQLSALYRW